MARETVVSTRARVRTPRQAAGAIAIIEVCSDDPLELDKVFTLLSLDHIQIGAMRLRSIAGIDEGIVARLDQTTAWLMPHGGIAVVREVLAALADAGVKVQDQCEGAPSSLDDVERCMLDVLARAASPDAVDLLLDQPRLWREAVQSNPNALDRPATDLDHVLLRLVDPALVVMVGTSNIGKSTLTNTLAGRGVSIVADEPGTTRDHVGVLIDMAGLVVRWVDTPGLREGATPEEALARESALRLAKSADLVVLAGDLGNGPVAWEGSQPVLRACLRMDRSADQVAGQTGSQVLNSNVPSWDVRLSCVTGEGIEALVARIRQQLIGNMVASNQAWRFWAD